MASSGGKKTAAEAKSSRDEVASLAGIVAGASRLLNLLSVSPALKEGHLGLAEWLALNIFAQGESSNNKLLAKKLQVTVQRAKQICDALQGAGLISVTPSNEDSRKNDIAITEGGQTRLAEVNAKMKAMIGAMPATGAARLSSLDRNIRRTLAMLPAHQAKLPAKAKHGG